MAATTSEAIRTNMRAAVRALVPTQPATKFDPYNEDQGAFRLFAERDPQSAFRKVSILDLFVLERPHASNTDTEWIETTFECVVGYPRERKYPGVGGLGLANVLDRDMKQIDHAIGSCGDGAGPDAYVETLGGGLVEDGRACVFGVLKFRVQYRRSFP